MKPTDFNNMIADQQFKISKADENISNFLIDCGSLPIGHKNIHGDQKVPNGAHR